MHGRLEPAQVHAGAAHHRLGGPRRGDEAQQLGGRPAVWSCAGQRHRGPAALGAAGPGPSRVTSRPAARSPATAKRTARAKPSLRLVSSRAAASLWKMRCCCSGTPSRRSIAGTTPSVVDGGRARGTRSGAGPGRGSARARPAGGRDARHGQHLVQRGTGSWTSPSSGALERGPDRHVDGAGRRAARGTRATGCTLSSTSRSAARLGEQVDQAGRGVLGEQVRGRHPEHPPAVRRPG